MWQLTSDLKAAIASDKQAVMSQSGPWAGQEVCTLSELTIAPHSHPFISPGVNNPCY